MAVFNTIKVNNSYILAPNDFTPAREDVYAGEITTCTGKLIADRIGWKYADLTLEWDHLPQAQLSTLMSLSGTFTLEFKDANGSTISETAIRNNITMTGTRFTDGAGNPVWKDVRIGISFIDVH